MPWRSAQSHVGVDVAAPAVALAELAGDDREAAARCWRSARGSAGRRPRSRRCGWTATRAWAGSIGRWSSQPPQVARPVEPAEQHRLAGRRSRAPRRAVPAGRRRVAAEVSCRGGRRAAPSRSQVDVVGLVVEVEETLRSSRYSVATLRQKVGSVFGVGQRRAGRWPVRTAAPPSAGRGSRRGRPARARTRTRESRSGRRRR